MLETERCLLTNIQMTDYEEVMKLFTDEKVREFLGGVIDKEEYMSKFNKMIDDYKSLYLVIRFKANNQFIGLLSIDPYHDQRYKEISYQLLPEWWGAGIAYEVIKRLIDYSFTELSLEALVAETQLNNISSCKLLGKLGMTLVETVQRFGEEQNVYILYRK